MKVPWQAKPCRKYPMDAIALSRSLLDETSAEPDLRRFARAYVKKGRGSLLERHRGGAGGMEVVTAYSTMMDHLIGYLFAKVSDDFIRRFPTQDQRCRRRRPGRLWQGRAQSLFRYRSVVSLLMESIALRRGRDREAALHPVGRWTPGRSRHPHRERIHRFVCHRHESENRAAGRALPLR